MDISDALMAKSNQLNAIDLIGREVKITVVAVKKSDDKQKVVITTDVFGADRPWHLSKTVLRIIANAWGPETSEWIGRKITLYREPTVKYAGQEIGGIRVKALSNIKRATSVNLPASKLEHADHVVQPLPDAAPPPVTTPTKQRDWLTELTLAGDDLEAVASLGKAATDAHAAAADIAAIRARYGALKGTP